jgi:hypothetical protein
MIRRFAVLFLLLTILFLGSAQYAGQAAVSPDIAQETAYVLDTLDPGEPYNPPGTEIPYEGPSTPSATQSTQTTSTQTTPPTPTTTLAPGSTRAATDTATVTPTGTVTATSGPSPTPGRDLFGTEDAEMGNSRVTPPPSETPAPSKTPTPSASPTATPALPAGFLFNPIWFFGGLAVSLIVFLIAWLVIRAKRSGEFG